MANTITTTTVHDGPRNFVVLVNVVGDGSGDETKTQIVDRSQFAPPDGAKTVVEAVEGAMGDFTAQLFFDATTDLVFAQFAPNTWFKHRWQDFGGLSSSKAGTGATGDILMSTSGLGSGENATFTLHMRK